MANAAVITIRRRTFEPYRTPYGRHLKYGPWVKVGLADGAGHTRYGWYDVKEAHAAFFTVCAKLGGLYEYALFFRGRRLTRGNGALKDGVL
jgi:hypothetical protein